MFAPTEAWIAEPAPSPRIMFEFLARSGEARDGTRAAKAAALPPRNSDSG
jgi:hypothetical protein